MVDGGVGIETPDDPQRDDAGRRDDSPGFDIQARDIANGIQPPERPRIRTELFRFWEWRRRRKHATPATD